MKWRKFSAVGAADCRDAVDGNPLLNTAVGAVGITGANAAAAAVAACCSQRAWTAAIWGVEVGQASGGNGVG